MSVDQGTIAQHLGVSQATVSRALNRHPRISAGTQRRVLRAAERLGYSPDGIAQILTRRRTGFVGILAHSLTASFTAEVIDGAEKAVLADGRMPIISATNGSLQALESYVQHYRQYRIEGALVMGFQEREDLRLLERLRASAVPLVVVCGDLTAEGYPSVFIGERAIAGLAAEHLLSLGHRRIGCFCPPGSRRDAFRAAIPGDRIRAEWIVAPAGSVDDNVRRLSELLRRRERPTAIFAYSDVDAALCLKAAVRGGVRVPGELSVLGSDDLPLATLVEPELSTVRQPKFEQGAEAYALLKRVMQGASSVGQVVLKAELVQRGSTGRPDVA